MNDRAGGPIRLPDLVPGGCMEIRKAAEADLEKIMEIYAEARRFMAAHGNPNQWGPTNWPPRELIIRDIALGNSYICQDESGIAAVFFYTAGKDIEPTYQVIEEGQWLDDSPYGVVHRIATGGRRKGAAGFCLDWAYAQCGHLRIDTHGDNTVMQALLRKKGFIQCGIIHVEEDDYPRLAFEKTERLQ